jgi:hypothetical protein
MSFEQITIRRCDVCKKTTTEDHSSEIPDDWAHLTFTRHDMAPPANGKLVVAIDLEVCPACQEYMQMHIVDGVEQLQAAPQIVQTRDAALADQVVHLPAKKGSPIRSRSNGR